VGQGVDSAFEPAPEASADALVEPAPAERQADASAGRAAPESGTATLSTDAAQQRSLLEKAAPPAEATSGGVLGAVPPATSRAQIYTAELTVRVADVDALSARTQEAIRLTRRLGGYVVSANFDAGTEGVSTLVVRVPVKRVQKAVAELSALGTLAAQDVSIRDAQGTLNNQTRRLHQLREEIARLRVQLARPDLSAADRAALELRLARAQRQAAETRAAQKALARRAAFATVSLELTTTDAAVAAPAPPGRIERAARDAASVLAKEVAWILYALIVAAPFVLIAAALAVGARAARRRADDRLLSRA
jgi:hypothetical protein